MRLKLSNEPDDFLASPKAVAGERAFSRVDLVALIFTIALVSTWVVVTHTGAIGRQVRCAANLSALGKAMHNYAGEHDGSLPAASVSWGGKLSSWDRP